MPKRKLILRIVACGIFLISTSSSDAKLSELLRIFARPSPSGLSQIPCLPTPNQHLCEDDMEGYVARTRTNEEYGLPGWTRGNGTRFHKGVDILPDQFEKLDQTVKIEYYDPKTGHSFSREEAVLLPKDEVYTILDGVVVVANRVEGRSGYGRYIMIEHRFADGQPFVSMYAHLDRLEVNEGDLVHRGNLIGWMGRTSSSASGRVYLMAIPHCHFEVGRVIDPNFPKLRSSKILYPSLVGGKYDPRNIQPYQPVQFLQRYHAQPKSAVTASRPAPSLQN